MKKILAAIILIAASAIVYSQTVSRTVSPSQITLAWNPVSGAASYFIYFGSSSGVYTNKQLVGTSTTYTVTNIVRGVTYYFAATAADSAGNESPYSNEASGQSSPLLPAPSVSITGTK